MKERAMCALPQTDSIFSLRKIELMAHGGYVRKVFFFAKLFFMRKIRACGSPSYTATQKRRLNEIRLYCKVKPATRSNETVSI